MYFFVMLKNSHENTISYELYINFSLFNRILLYIMLINKLTILINNYCIFNHRKTILLCNTVYDIHNVYILL